MIELVNILKSFKSKTNEKIILDNVSFVVKSNTIVLITGESGSGKSTLLDIISLNDYNYQGNLKFNAKIVTPNNLNNLKKRIVYLNQGQTMFLELKPYENTSLINSKVSFGLFSVIMSKFGLSNLINKKTGLLSGGEKQRVGIIRSLSKNCDWLIMDEPTSNLDQGNKSYFINEVVKHKFNKTIIIATHDKELYKIADQIIILKDGLIVGKKFNKIDTGFRPHGEINNHNNFLQLISLDIFKNKKKLIIFISALSNGLLGLLLGIIIVSGFEGFFVKMLVTQVPSNKSIAYNHDLSKLTYYDLDNFNTYIVCNSDYEIYCDESSGNVYASLEINNTMQVVKIINSDSPYISSAIYKNLDSNLLRVKYLDTVILSNAIPKVIESETLDIGLPYKLINKHLKETIGVDILADYIVFDHTVQFLPLIRNYKVVNVHQDYVKSFKEILDWVMFGFIIYSSVSLILGIISVSVLMVLDIESRRKHIGTLLLLGWNQLEIIAWVVISSLIKASLTSIVTIITVGFSINSLNKIIKDVTNLQLEFNFPDLSFLLGLIISLHLIVGSIAFFHIKNLLKLSPKQLISNK